MARRRLLSLLGLSSPGRSEPATVAEADRLRSERDALEEVLHHLPEGVAVTDAAGRVRRANPAFQKIFQGPSATPSEADTDPPSAASEALLRELTTAALAGEEASLGDLSRDLSLGPPGRRHITFRVSPLPAGAGAVVVARDVTDAVRSAESRRDLVANVSHELKTPLTAIRGYAETLQDGALEKPETAKRFTARILDQCERLEALLGDLLTLSKMEGQESPPSALETVDLGRLLREVAEVLTSRARAKEITLSFELAEPSPRVLGDAAELERLLLNLLENAIKYNRPGGDVHLRLSSGEGNAAVEIRDSGIGIPPEAKERIFERFYRVDKGRARDEGGTGLGLAIVKHAARRHGGTVEVESTLGKGSTFRVRLPLAPP